MVVNRSMPRGETRRILSPLMAGTAFVIALVGAGFSGTPASSAFGVRTESGRVTGVRENGAIVFKGIPFAAPPIGARRWAPPQPPVAWAGVRRADRFSHVCMQKGMYPPDAPAEPMSEDCLYLNIWVPASGAHGRLPVMVWIYGGGLENGSASTPLYWGDRLTRKGVIVVTANYRLGVFGFLAHPDLTTESVHHSSGDYGLLDQLASLNWVKRNIAAFGGDPDRITLFGQSSGSISISVLATSPLATGLFQRAIGESGGLLEPMEIAPAFTLAGAEQDGQSFVKRAGAATIAQLRRRPAADLMKTPFDAHLIIDGYALKQSPYDAYRQGNQNNVALLLGSNSDEGQTFIAGRAITPGNFTRELERDFPDVLVSSIKPESGPTSASARSSAAAFERDMRFRWDMWKWASLTADAGHNKVFFYQFIRVPPYSPGAKYFGQGASHGMEMPYVFDHLDQERLAWTSHDRDLTTDMSSYWTNFARSGDPNGSGLPRWPEYKTSVRSLMLLGDEIGQDTLRNREMLDRIDTVYSRFRHRSAPSAPQL